MATLILPSIVDFIISKISPMHITLFTTLTMSRGAMETHTSFIPKQLAQIHRFFDTHIEYVDVLNIPEFICPPSTTNTSTLFQLPNIPWNLTHDALFPLDFS